MNPLEQAIRNNNPNELKLLLDLGHDPNEKTSDRNHKSLTELAIVLDAVDCLEVLLDRDLADKEIRIWKGTFSLVCFALENYSVLCSRLLLERGVEVNAPHPREEKPMLHRLIESKRPEAPHLLRLLLEYGADVNLTDKNGKTILHLLTEIKHQDDVFYSFSKLLVENFGADLSISDNYGQTPLHIFAKMSNGSQYGDEIVKMNIKNGVDINGTDQFGNTPLMNAVKHKNETIAMALINSGANINIKNKNGVTAFDFVSQQHLTAMGNLVIMQAIITHANFNYSPVEDELYDWLLMIFKEHHHHHRYRKVNERHFTAFEKSKNQVNAFIKILIGKYPSVIDVIGHHLFYFVNNNQLSMARLIIEEYGADVNTFNENGVTPLYYAASKNQLDFAKLLVKHGALVTITNDFHITPLIEAAKNNADEVAKLLLEHGADIHVTDWEGNTAMDYAVQNGNSKLFRHLDKSRSL